MCGQPVALKATEQSGAASTLAVLYEEHATATFRYALHLTRRREDAEDVVQHVFMHAYRALESGTTLVSPRAWLMKAVKHRSLNVLRDRREHPMDEIVAELPAATAGPEDADELAAVRTMLWTLPEGQHSAFVLRHWSGLSQLEIAEVLDTTESAVESLLIRARAAVMDEAADAQTDCRAVRDRLVRFLPLRHEHESHVGRCRRCSTARARLARTAELAAALSLGPRPHVAHALASAIPGFGGGAAATAAGGGTTAGSVTAGSGSAAMTGSGTLVSSAPLMAKTGLAAKALAVVLAASAAAGTMHSLRQPVEQLVLGGARAQIAHRSHPSVHPASDRRSAAPKPASAVARQDIRPAQAALPPAGSPAPAQPPGNGSPGKPSPHDGAGKSGAAGGSTPPGHTGKNAPATPPGRSGKTSGGTPPGRARKTGTGTPPGQAKKTGNGTPPGQPKKTSAGTPPGQAKKTGTGTPHGQAKGAPNGQGAGSSNGNGAANGNGNSNAGGAGHSNHVRSAS
jgi:RNA polymerase sigma factor (sigma-70 family)